MVLLNNDLDVRAVVHAARLGWNASPTRGVDRRMLFRIGDEKARATSIVRYAPESRFPHHGHPGGEEFFVLEGTFQDETGDLPAGTVLNAKMSPEGAKVWLKAGPLLHDDVVKH